MSDPWKWLAIAVFAFCIGAFALLLLVATHGSYCGDGEHLVFIGKVPICLEG